MASVTRTSAAVAGKGRCVMYLTGQHNIIPTNTSLTNSITHVILAFMPSSRFTKTGKEDEQQQQSSSRDWPLFDTVENVRGKFTKGTKIMVAIGGWGDTRGFEQAAISQESRLVFAENVRKMVEDTGADGVDIDWEYPGGNGEDYKQNPNSGKQWQIQSYVSLLSIIRSSLPPHILLSAAVPGLTRDMISFTANTLPSISQSLDFFNIMTYDLMNRRDVLTTHHAGVENSLITINTYLANGVPADKINLGFAFYIKWFHTDDSPENKQICQTGCPINRCKPVLMEDPTTGADLSQCGAFSWHDIVPEHLQNSFHRAMKQGEYDDQGGGQYYYDAQEDIFWTWENEGGIEDKFVDVVVKHKLGGVFAWGLGEDGEKWEHLEKLVTEYDKYFGRLDNDTEGRNILFPEGDGGRKQYTLPYEKNKVRRDEL